MQQLQQQLMIKKMQELQRQQQLKHLDLRQLNLINDVSPFAKQTSGSQSTLVNGPSKSDRLDYPWTSELSTNWLNWGSPNTQGSPNGHGFQPNLGQPLHLVDLVPQRVDQLLYGAPISCSRGLPVDQFSQMVTARSSVPQMSTSSNYLQVNQHNSLQDQVGVQNENTISIHKFQNENVFGLASALSQDTGMRNIGGPQQVNSMPGNALQQDFLGRQELAVQPETSHEKRTMQVASPLNEVALDPTEEKILFGSDDNIWAAFGKVSGESGNSFNNAGLSNGLPSFHSGSWSALMQSAVAETSSSDIVPQEEWSGLIFHNNDSPSANQPPSMDSECCKRESSLANGNMRIPSALSSGSYPPSDDISTTNVMGLNDLGQRFQNEPGQILQTEMTETFFQSLEGSVNRSSTGLRQNLAARGSQIYGDSSQHPLQPDISAKTNSPTWMPGQTTTRLQSNVASIPYGVDRVTITHDAEKTPQNSQVRVMQGEVAHGSSLWKSNAVPSSVTELDRVNSRISNHPENLGILSLKDASVARSSKAWSNDESSSFVQNNYLLNQWKNACPPARPQDGGSVGRPLHLASDTSQDLDSMKSYEKVPRHDIKNCYGKENSGDSHCSNLSQHISGGFREGGFSDVSDSQSHPTGKQKTTNQLSRKVSALRKFQYHPMGNADEDMEPTYGQKQPTHVQAMPQQNAYFGRSKIFDQVPRDSIIMEKGQGEGQSSEIHRNAQGTDKESSHGNLSGHSPNTPNPFSQPIEAHTSNNTSSSSQNMLELLHKVDQSRNHGVMMQFSSSECKSSSQQPEAETFDGFGHLQHGQSSVSQGFGLQLGPPSQKLRTTDHPFTGQIGQGTFSSLHSSSAAAGMGQKGRQIVSSHSVQSLSSTEETQVELGQSRSTTPGHGVNESSLYKTPENFTSAFHFGTPHSKGNFQNQQIKRASGQMSMKQHIEPFDANGSYSGQKRPSILPDVSGSFQQDNIMSGGMHRQSGQNDVQERVPTTSISSGDHEQTFQHFPMPGIGQQADSTQMLHTMWTHVPTLEHNKSVQFQHVPLHISESPQPNIVESSSASLMQGCVNSHGFVNGGELSSRESSGQPVAAVNNNLVPKMKDSLGIGSPVENHFDDFSANSASTQEDIEAFGRSLKPNSYSQSYLLHSQMNVLKDGESDSSNRFSKWMRGPDNIAEAQQAALKIGLLNEHNAVAGDSLGSSSGIPIEDSKIPGFSRPSDIFQRKNSQQGNVSSHGSLGLTGDVSQSFPCNDYMNSLRVSPQMAPLWFSQYGIFKNGQMLQINDANRVTPLKTRQPPFTSGKASSGMDMLNPEEKGTSTAVDTCQIDNSHRTSTSVANEHFTSPLSSQLNVTGQHLVILRPKKRKAPERHPWHNEISEGSQDLWSVSMAVTGWNKAANCLSEKVEDDAETIEDGPPVDRSKRRLILTTYLMQLLLRTEPADVLCIDASSYEIVAYTVSRIALGDACRMASCSSNFDAPCDGMDLLPMKGNSQERNGGGSYAKATEQLVGRARKLENDFLRLDESVSVLDLRVECQDLEKFSNINRFARFHGRAQTDNADTASTEMSVRTQKPIPQRYVTALPMPRSLPDEIQCLSL